MQLTPEQINDFLAKSIMESQIGDAVKASVARVLSNLNKSWDNPIDAVIKQEVMQMIRTEIITTHREAMIAMIRDKVASKLTDDFIDKIITAGLNERH